MRLRSLPPRPDSTEKKAEEIQQAYKHDDLAGMVAAVTGESSKPQPLPDWKPAPAALLSSQASKIPLRKSLRLVEVGTEELRRSLYRVEREDIRSKSRRGGCDRK